ncbi:MAG: cytochrome c oxidase assembly protein [Tepidiformaceae bacterium]
MDDAPGLWEILSNSSFDAGWTIVLIVSGGWYLHSARRLAPATLGVPHPRWRTVCFLGGLVLVAVAVMSPVHEYGNDLLWVNFSGFLVLSMLAPPLLVLGAPLTLAFRAAGKPGRRQLRRFYRNRVARFVTFPVVAWLLFAAVTYIWQFSSLTEAAARDWVVRDLQQAMLLLVGLVFWYVALAVDPVFWRMSYPLRVLFVGVEMVHKGLFGGMFLSMSTPFHNQFAENLPAWGPSAMTDQRLAILILWIGGNIVFIAAIVGLISGWLRYEGRNQHRVDRRLEQAREAARQRRAALDRVFTKGV